MLTKTKLTTFALAFAVGITAYAGDYQEHMDAASKAQDARITEGKKGNGIGALRQGNKERTEFNRAIETNHPHNKETGEHEDGSPG